MEKRKLPSTLTHLEGKLTQFDVEHKNKFYEHQDMPGKLIRLDKEAYETHKFLPYFKVFLKNIEEQFHIPTVHPEYAVTADVLPPLARQLGMKPSNIDVVTVMDKIEGMPALEVLKQDEVPAEVVSEFDLLSQRMIEQLRHVYENGGFHCQEIYRYEQFMYSPAAKEGERLILVDVEPIGFYFHYPQSERAADAIPVEIIETVATITEDIVELEKKIGHKLAAHSAVVDFIASVDSNGFDSMEEAKRRILQALELQAIQPLEAFMGLDDGVFSKDWKHNSSIAVEWLLNDDATVPV